MKLPLHFFLLLTAVLTALLPQSAQAQVPGLLNYQGKVAVGPTPFTGSGQFRFALVNGSGTTTYWSHDGSSTAGAQPTSAVTLPVANGLYAVLLGDAAIAGMTSPVPASVFANSDVRLRVWFSDGTNGSQLLTPDKRIAAVAYAMVAASLDAAGMTAVQQTSQTAVDAAITAAVTTTTTAKAASDATIADLRSQLVTKDASITTLTADKTLLTTQLATANAKYTADTATLNRRLTEATANIADLEDTLGVKDARINELIDSEQAAQDALAVEKAKCNDLILYTNYGITSAENDISSTTLARIGDLNRFQTDIRSAELRGLNEGITTTAVTVGGKTTTSRVVTGSSPQVKLGTVIYGYSIYSRQIYRLERLFSTKLLTGEVVYDVVTDTPGTPNGTVVTTTPGLNGLNAQVASLTADKTALTADKTLLTTQLAAANAKCIADTATLNRRLTEATANIADLEDTLGAKDARLTELIDSEQAAQVALAVEKNARAFEMLTQKNLVTKDLQDLVAAIRDNTERPTNEAIESLNAQIRGLNEGTTTTATTLNGKTTSRTVVTNSSPLAKIGKATFTTVPRIFGGANGGSTQVTANFPVQFNFPSYIVVYDVVTDTPGTPNGTVVTTTPGINGLNAQVASLTADKTALTADKTALTADKTLLTTQLATANAKYTADTATLNRRLTEATANIADLEDTLGLKNARITELIDSEQAAKDALAVEKAKYNNFVLLTDSYLNNIEKDFSAATLGRIGDLNRFQTDIRSAELRGLNEGTTTTAVTVGGKTTTSRVVTGSSPQVKLGTVIYGDSIYSRMIYTAGRFFSTKLLTCEVVYDVVTDTPGTPNGTVVTTTPGINGLNAQIAALQAQIVALQNPPAP